MWPYKILISYLNNLWINCLFSTYIWSRFYIQSTYFLDSPISFWIMSFENTAAKNRRNLKKKWLKNIFECVVANSNLPKLITTIIEKKKLKWELM